MRRREPVWLSRGHIEAIHALQLEQHGGSAGLRDAGALESAVARPQHRWHCTVADDIAACAATYGFAIAKTHAFNDGNKRTAYQAMFVFLGLNGLDLAASEPDAVVTMLALATDATHEAALARWLRANVKKRRR